LEKKVLRVLLVFGVLVYSEDRTQNYDPGRASYTQQNGATEIAGLDIVGPVWQGWTMTDDLRTA